ncbi:MAG: hypothetical protein QG650_868 [Patescibacteria group bacterium]|nr:hypothetical protein [Patescibacteria group bacterium]
MGGSVNFVMPLERFRKDVDRALEFVRDDYDGAKIIYQSWVDGQEES